MDILTTDYAALLDVYSLTEILEHNDLTEEETLLFLVENEFIILPDILPIDFNDG